VQYDFGLESLSTQFIAGADANLTTPRTEGEILGRNEDDDRIREYGLYTQSTTDLSERFALTLAARGDYNNIVDNLQISPRAALVFKATPSNTFRASYNRSFSSPSTNSNFLDIGAQSPIVGQDSQGNPLFLEFRGFGAARGFTFNEDRAAFLVPSDPLFGQPFRYSDVGGAYTVGAGGVAQQIQAGNIPSALQEQGLSSGQIGLLAQLLGYTAQNSLVDGPTDAASFFVQGDDGLESFGEPTNIDPLEQTTTQTYELGYKGLLGERLVVQIDGYYERKENFISPLRVQTPFVVYGGDALSQDVGAAVGQLFATTDDPNVQGLLNQLVQSGLSSEQVAGLMAGLVGGAVGGQQVGIVQPDVAFPDEPAESQDIVPGSNDLDGDGFREVAGGFLSYRNFGRVEYWGIDASVDVQATDAFSIFSNMSIVSDDFFDNEELGEEEDTNLNVALNAPSFKAKGGFDYAFENGFSFGATGNYVEGFPVRSGPYVGDVDTYFLLDLRAGYDVPSIPGLRLDVSANNVLDNEHRQFVGAPELGITIFGSATYTLQ
jgi:iron complex outermembrane receptor protein